MTRKIRVQDESRYESLPLSMIVVDYSLNSRNNGQQLDPSDKDLDIDGLAESIKEESLLQPPVVWETEDEEGKTLYKVLSGFRRMLAITHVLKWDAVTVKIIKAKDLEDALFKNLASDSQTKKITANEQAHRFHQLKSMFNTTGAEIARRSGYSSKHVNNYIRVLEKASPRVLHAFERCHEEGLLKSDDFVRIVALKDHDAQGEKLDELYGLRKKAVEIAREEEEIGHVDDEQTTDEKAADGTLPPKMQRRSTIEEAMIFLKKSDCDSGKIEIKLGRDWLVLTEDEKKVLMAGYRWVLGQIKSDILRDTTETEEEAAE